MNNKNIKVDEWKYQKRWNAFNSYKLLAHVDRWSHIKFNEIVPAPVLVTVDPANACNLKCAWCNAQYILNERHNMISEKVLCELAEFLPKWGNKDKIYEPGVKAVCVAGGGEPLLNPSTPVFIDQAVKNNIEVGVVTNGTRIDTCMDSLSKCTWVGCSVDAATEKTFNALKGLSHEAGAFSKIINNIANLTEYANSHDTQLGKKRPAYGVSYKFLLYKENIGEVYKAAKLAKSIGCKSIHFRPAGTTWDHLGTSEEIIFNDDDIMLWNEQIALAQELDDDSFGVYGVTHKFNDNFGISNSFKKCYAIFMTAVISPPTDGRKYPDSFNLGLCCDRRGDQRLELLHDCESVDEIEKVWGSNEHWRIFSGINVCEQCPRCTYQPHNQIYQEVILNDSMTYKFI